ncbi:MAG: hypothetical protein U0822_08725 [Anaerolineae bacterium]
MRQSNHPVSGYSLFAQTLAATERFLATVDPDEDPDLYDQTYRLAQWLQHRRDEAKHKKGRSLSTSPRTLVQDGSNRSFSETFHEIDRASNEPLQKHERIER